MRHSVAGKTEGKRLGEGKKNWDKKKGGKDCGRGGRRIRIKGEKKRGES